MILFAIVAAIGLMVGCGVGGIIRVEPNARLSRGEKKAMPRLWAALTQRGTDACGFSYEDGGTAYTLKTPGSAKVKSHLMQRNLKRGIRWMMMHTRAATTGKPEDNRNNHPLRHGNILGIHNGWFTGWRHVFNRLGWKRHEAGTEVDSEAALACIAREGLAAVSKRLGGPATLIWTDITDTQALRLWTNGGSPLWFAKTHNGNILFASTKGILVQACKNIIADGPWEAEDCMEYVGDVAGLTPLKTVGTTYEFATNYGGFDWDDDWWKEYPAPKKMTPKRKQLATSGSKGASGAVVIDDRGMRWELTEKGNWKNVEAIGKTGTITRLKAEPPRKKVINKMTDEEWWDSQEDY